ncbi:MAG: hypothetical protein FVQ80_18325 [Planctomycetes bacterium]|nr:hypothetical protein [Planctomycetota bacterium]
MTEREVQEKMPGAIRSMVKDLQGRKFSGSIIIDFQKGEVMNVTIKESISASKIIEKYTPKIPTEMKKFVVISKPHKKVI